jgi:hypothetical protein
LQKTIAVTVFTLHWSACGYWMIVRLEGTDVTHCNDDITVSDCNLWHPPSFIKEDDLAMQYSYRLALSKTTKATHQKTLNIVEWRCSYAPCH